MKPLHTLKRQRRGLVVLAEAFKRAHSERVIDLFEFPYLPHPKESYPPFWFLLNGSIPAVASFKVCRDDYLSVHVAVWPTENAERLVSDFNADFDAGEAFVVGALSPVPTRQLICVKPKIRLRRRPILDQLVPPSFDEMNCFLGSHLKRRDGSVSILDPSNDAGN